MPVDDECYSFLNHREIFEGILKLDFIRHDLNTPRVELLLTLFVARKSVCQLVQVIKCGLIPERLDIYEFIRGQFRTIAFKLAIHTKIYTKQTLCYLFKQTPVSSFAGVYQSLEK